MDILFGANNQIVPGAEPDPAQSDNTEPAPAQSDNAEAVGTLSDNFIIDEIGNHVCI